MTYRLPLKKKIIFATIGALLICNKYCIYYEEQKNHSFHYSFLCSPNFDIEFEFEVKLVTFF